MKKNEKVILVTIITAGIAGLGYGIYRLQKGPPGPPPPPPGLANLYGIVTDAETGQPLADVLVTANSWQVDTGSKGYYEFTGVEPGTYTIRFAKTNYEEVSMSITLSADESRELNVQMISLAPLTATLYGRVADATTGAALQGVEILLDTLFGDVTDANGNYLIQGIPPGTYTVTFAKAGYQTVYV